MNQLAKAQITVSLLGCLSLGWRIIQEALASTLPLMNTLGYVALQLGAIIIISVVVLSILEWAKIFDIKTNGILTLISVITFRMTFSM